jgi:hypothetical protein
MYYVDRDAILVIDNKALYINLQGLDVQATRAAPPL